MAEVSFRRAVDADAAAVAALHRDAFGDHTGEALTDVASVLTTPGWVAVAGTEVVGTVGVDLRGQWFGGRRLITARVCSLAVGTGHRGDGLGRRLLIAALDDARLAGASLSALIPSLHSFYRKLGYGIAGRRTMINVSTDVLRAALPTVPRDHRVRAARADDSTAVAELVAHRARGGAGLLDHCAHPVPTARSAAPSGTVQPATPEDVAGPGRWVVERDGLVVGWASVRRRPSARPGVPYDVTVEDLIGENDLAAAALWSEVVAGHPAPIEATVPFPVGGFLELRLPRWTSGTDAQTWMLALLDLDSALAGRGYPEAVTADLRLTILPPQGRDGATIERRLRVAGGVARLDCPHDEMPASPAGPVQVAADVLASLYTGYLDPWQAAQLGLLQAEESQLTTLRALFAGPAATLARPF